MTRFYDYNKGAGFIRIEADAGTGARDFGGGITDPTEMRFLRARKFDLPTGLKAMPSEDIRQKDEELPPQFFTDLQDGSIVTELHGVATTIGELPAVAPGNLMASAPPLATLLKCGLGSCFAGVNTTIVSEAYGVVSVASAAGIRVGEIYAITRDGSVLWVAGVTEVDGSDVTLDPVPQSYSYEAGDRLVGGYTYSMLPGEPWTFSAVRSGDAADDATESIGIGVTKTTLNAPYRDVSTVEFALKVAASDAPGSAKTIGGQSPQTYSYPGGPQVIGGGLWIDRGVEVIKLAGGIQIEVDNDLQDVGGVHGSDPNGILGMAYGTRTVRITLTPAYSTAAHWDWIKANTQSGFCVVGWAGIGGNVWAFRAPASCFQEVPEKTEQNKQHHEKWVLLAGANNNDTGTFTDSEAGAKPFALWQLSAPSA